MNIYNICDNRSALIFQWNADECSMHLLHLHTCCVCSRPEIVTFNKLRIHVPPHPWQGCYVRLESISKAYLLITDALPSRKTKIDWTCFAWMLVLSFLKVWLVSNELEVTSLNDILAQAEILERICRVCGCMAGLRVQSTGAWNLTCCYAKNNIQPARQSLDTVPRSGEDENHPEIWGLNRMSETVTLRSLWMNEYKSKNLDTDSPDRRPRQRTCCNVLVYCLFFFWTEQGCWQLRFLESIQNFYFTFEDALTWSVIVATRIFTWRFGWLYLKSMWMEQTKRHWNRAWGRRAAGLFSVKRQYTAFWHTQVLKSRRLTKSSDLFWDVFRGNCAGYSIYSLGFRYFHPQCKTFLQNSWPWWQPLKMYCKFVTQQRGKYWGARWSSFLLTTTTRCFASSWQWNRLTISIDLFYYQTSGPNRGNMRKIRSPQTSCTWKLLWPYVFQCTMECAAKVPTQLAANPLYLRLVACT